MCERIKNPLCTCGRLSRYRFHHHAGMPGWLIVLLAVVALFVAYLVLKAFYAMDDSASMPEHNTRPSTGILSTRPLAVGPTPIHPMLRHLLQDHHHNDGSNSHPSDIVPPTFLNNGDHYLYGGDQSSDALLRHRIDSSRPHEENRHEFNHPSNDILGPATHEAVGRPREQTPLSNNTAQSSAAQQQRSPLCVICLDKEKEILLKPCRHFCVCFDCAIVSEECPICRKPIADREKIYDT